MIRLAVAPLIRGTARAPLCDREPAAGSPLVPSARPRASHAVNAVGLNCYTKYGWIYMEELLLFEL